MVEKRANGHSRVPPSLLLELDEAALATVLAHADNASRCALRATCVALRHAADAPHLWRTLTLATTHALFDASQRVRLQLKRYLEHTIDLTLVLPRTHTHHGRFCPCRGDSRSTVLECGSMADLGACELIQCARGLTRLNLSGMGHLTPMTLSRVLSSATSLERLKAVGWWSLGVHAEPLDSVFACMPRSTRLTHLDVSHSGVTTEILSALLARSPNLLRLDANSCDNLGEIELSALPPRLEHISVLDCVRLRDAWLRKVSAVGARVLCDSSFVCDAAMGGECVESSAAALYSLLAAYHAALQAAC